MENKDFKIIINSKHKMLDLHIRETFHYFYLILLFVKRDFTTKYKQTLFGPLWALIQPLLTTLVFTFVFGTLAGLATSDTPDLLTVPGFLFYMSGTIIFGLFSSNVASVSRVFIANKHTMGKVYYPRFVQPIATSLFNLLSFGIQFLLFFFVWLGFLISGTTNIAITPWLCFLPVVIIQTLIFSMGVGMIIASVTTKYRDLQMLVSFGLQLWQYASPVAYGLLLITQNEKFSELVPWYLSLNPMSTVITTFRYAMFGTGYFDIMYYLIGVALSLIIFFIGLLLFSKTERNFMDTI